MKLLKTLSLALLVGLAGCSGDDSPSETNPVAESPYAMTAKINGVLTNMQNPFGTNEASSHSMFTDYPDAEFIHLQGRPLGEFWQREVSIYIKRTDLAVGTYNFTFEDQFVGTFVKMINNTNDIWEDSVSGKVVITEINTDTKFVKGTFDVQIADEAEMENPVIHTSITEGTFNYYYDVED